MVVCQEQTPFPNKFRSIIQTANQWTVDGATGVNRMSHDEISARVTASIYRKIADCLKILLKMLANVRARARAHGKGYCGVVTPPEEKKKKTSSTDCCPTIISAMLRTRNDVVPRQIIVIYRSLWDNCRNFIIFVIMICYHWFSQKCVIR